MKIYGVKLSEIIEINEINENLVRRKDGGDR